MSARSKLSRPPATTAGPTPDARPGSTLRAPAVTGEPQGRLREVASDVSSVRPSESGAHRFTTAGSHIVRADPPAAVLMTIDEAAEALRVPRSWLRDRVSARLVPHTRLGRHVRFTPAHLAQIIASGEEPSCSTPVPTGGNHRRRSPSC